jgi:uncharacterized phage protein (TIGR02218 family)
MSLLDAALEPAVTALAVCWRLSRADGVVLGFTSHDRDLLVDGVVFRATPGMTPSAVAQTDSLEGDSMALEGVLDAAAITAADLAAGRWSGAVVEVLVCDWSDTSAGFLCLSRGRIGELARPCSGGRGAFQVELLSDVEVFDDVLPVRLSPICRNDLGDRECGVDLGGIRREWAVDGGKGSRLILAPGLGDAVRYAGGRLRFIRGPLSGIDRNIVEATSGEFRLDSAVPEHGLPGAWVRLTPGCDKRISTCRDRYRNVVSFGGEPHVPGTDALLRYARP